MRVWAYSYRLATAADMGTIRIDIVVDEAVVLSLFYCPVCTGPKGITKSPQPRTPMNSRQDLTSEGIRPSLYFRRPPLGIFLARLSTKS